MKHTFFLQGYINNGAAYEEGKRVLLNCLNL